MNTFLEGFGNACSNILPFVGIVTLGTLIYLLIKLIKIVENANVVIEKGKVTVEMVDESIKKVQAPLDSAVKISHTIDVAHDATLKGINDAREFVSKNAEVIRERLNDINKKEAEMRAKEIKEPNPDDILKGE